MKLIARKRQYHIVTITIICLLFIGQLKAQGTNQSYNDPGLYGAWTTTISGLPIVMELHPNGKLVYAGFPGTYRILDHGKLESIFGREGIQVYSYELKGKVELMKCKEILRELRGYDTYT